MPLANVLRPAVIGCALLAIGALHAQANAEANAQANAEAQPPIVENPATPAEGKQTRTATELWRVGGEGEEDYDFFGYVSQVVVDGEGTSYLLDQQLCEVKAFDAEGNHLATFGREGEAPGEFFRPQGLLLMPDGKVGVLHGRPTRVSLFEPDGTIAGDVVLGGEDAGMGFVPMARSNAGHVVVEKSGILLREKTVEMTQSLVSLAADGTYRTTFLERTDEQDQMGGGPGRGRGRGVRIMLSGDNRLLHRWALGPDGRVYVAPRDDAYEVHVYGPDGTHERTIRRAYERVKLSDAEMDRARERNAQMAERFGGEAEEVEEFRADIRDMLVVDGELWIRSSAGLPEEDSGSLGTFDVFDAEGRFVRQVEVKVPYHEGRDDFTLVGDRLVVVEEAAGARQNMNSGFGMMIVIDGSDTDDGEARPLSVVSYRLETGD